MKEKISLFIGNTKAALSLLPLWIKCLFGTLTVLVVFFVLNLGVALAVNFVPKGDVERHLNIDGSATTLIVDHGWFRNTYTQTNVGILGSFSRKITKGEYQEARTNIGL